MKIRKGFTLRSVADTSVVVPLGGAAEKLNGFITLNNSGVMLWKLLSEGADEPALEQALLDRYDVTPVQAHEDVAEFIGKLRKANVFDE